jgi:hypothetical protein
MRCSKAWQLYDQIRPLVLKSRSHTEAVGAYIAHMDRCQICTDHNRALVEWARHHEEPIEVTDELTVHSEQIPA